MVSTQRTGISLARQGWPGRDSLSHPAPSPAFSSCRNAVPVPQDWLAAAVLAAACWPASRPKPELRTTPIPAAATHFLLPSSFPLTNPHSHLHSSPPFFSDFPASFCVSSRHQSSQLEKNKTEASSSSLSTVAVLTAPSSWDSWTGESTPTVCPAESPACPPPAREAEPERGMSISPE